MRRLLHICAAMALVAVSGCSGGDDGGNGTAPSAAVTNEVTVTRVVAVTNVVTVTVTNLVDETLPRIPSARGTAPYAISSATLDPARLAALLSGCGARVMECSAGSVALVEASERTVASLRSGSVVSVHSLFPRDKVAANAGGRVSIVPLSSIDVKRIAEAVVEAGGKVIGVVESGRPEVRAELPYGAVRKLAGRGDVRRIERDEK